MCGDAATPRDVLQRVKPELARQGHRPEGPHPGGPGGNYLTLGDGRRVIAERDGAGCWRLLVYGLVGAESLVSLYELTSKASPDGRDFPGDPV